MNPLARRDFIKKTALAAGTGLTAPLWLSRALAAGASTTAAVPATD